MVVGSNVIEIIPIKLTSQEKVHIRRLRIG
jgi:hypothetical protein